MLSLMLLRHAKSSWNDRKLDDFSRPLAPRGLKAAPRIGGYIKRRGLLPDLILCSTAQRTRETLGLILPYLDQDATIQLRHELYHSESANALVDNIRQQDKRFKTIQDKRFKTIMVIGHNPALQDLALSLIQTGAESDRQQLAAKFPTAALAVIRFNTSHWQEIGPTGHLERLVLPRLLDND